MLATALLLLLLVVVACSSSSPATDDPNGLVCEYQPFGDGAVSFTEPTREQLGDFDTWARVRAVTNFEDIGNGAEIDLEFTEVISGDLAEGRTWRTRNAFGLCLEPGRDYYVLINEAMLGGFLEIPHPWATFPVINNRITLHPDMRKDNLIGNLHGLDPVLFERRFVELVGRTDIEVD